jgi:hypothetical protein
VFGSLLPLAENTMAFAVPVQIAATPKCLDIGEGVVRGPGQRAVLIDQQRRGGVALQAVPITRVLSRGRHCRATTAVRVRG